MPRRAARLTPEQHQSTLEKLRRAHQGDAQAREELVCENLALVKYLVRRFADRGCEYEDLYQYGCLGLLKAIDRFDPDVGTAFSTYAVPVILGEIRRFLRDDGSIHVARSIKENARRVEAVRDQILQARGTDATVEEICEHLSLSREDAVLALNATRSVRSLDAPLEAGGETRLYDTISVDDMAGVEQKILLESLLNALPREDMRLIAMRYFQRRTQSDIAREMGITQVQVSRRESRILKRLRTFAESGL